MTPPGSQTAGLPDGAAAAEWLAASPAALACCDAAGELRWANPACAGVVGSALHCGLPLAPQLDLVDNEGSRLQDLLTSGGRAELQRRDTAAGARWLRIDVKLLGDGTRLLALSALDALKAAVADAQSQREMLDLARSMGRIGVWSRDIRSGRGRWDRQVFRMRGMDGEDGESPSLEAAMETVLEPDRAAFAESVRQSIAQAGSYNHRYRVLAGGAVRHLQSHWVVKNGSDGQPERMLGVIMDDTDTWAMAQSYGETVSQLALAVDLAGIGIWRHDLASDRMHYNAQALATLGLQARSGGIPLAEIRELIHPDDLGRVLASAQTTLETGRPTDFEARYRRVDGEYRMILLRRAVQRDADGSLLGFIGVALDVTERIDESRRAVELGRRFELATRAAGIGYWSLEAGADRARWSDQLHAIHGLPTTEPVPSMREWLATYLHPDDRDGVRQRYIEWARSGSSYLEADFRIVRGDGQVRYLSTHSRIEGDSPRSLLFGLVTDMTDRHNAEIALRQASERATLATRGAGLGTWELDLRNGTGFWDEQMWRLSGLEPRPQPPTLQERLAMVHPDDRAALQPRMEAVTQDVDLPTDTEFRIVLPDGGVRWLASRSAAFRDEQGRVVRRIGVNWDVTDSRTAEAVRQEREIALRESQAKSKFLARMSHELRTPLNAVLGFAQLLLVEDQGSDPAAASRRRRLEHIRGAGQHLLELINDVLDLSSLEGGEVRIALQPVPLAPLLAETLPLIEPLLRQHGIELVTGALDGVPLADATRLRQILLNLLSNAIKYNHDGGRITIEALRRGGSVLVRVSDNGRGMNDLQLRHLFEPFNRLGIESEGIEGTGIGLAIVKALVERMGGSVHVDSAPGQGSVFELRLADGSAHAPPPASAAPANRTVPLADTKPPRGTLLYVEDNPVNAMIISELIARRSDLKLHIAEDGLSGVRKAVELRPDLVLLDMQLPDIDGHEVLRRLRADARTSAIPVIALSANAMPEDIDRALRAGMSDYWTKPLDFRAFMASIDALFGPAP